MNIKEEIYNKMEKEYNDFIDKIKSLDIDEIIESAYGITVRKEILLFFESDNNYDIRALRKLIREDNPLDKLYQDWLKTDGGIHEALRDSVNDSLEDLVKDKDTKVR